MATLKNLIIDDTGFLKLPAGTGAQRPVGEAGMIRYNTSTNTVEVWEPSKSEWQSVATGGSSLYAFTSHTFTTGGQAQTKTGPTLSQIRSSYSSTSWAADGQFLKMDWYNGIQIWTIPKNGTYRIRAAGAGHTGYSYAWGGIVEARFTLVAGNKLAIAVGQRGSDTNEGCGGTFVAEYNESSPTNSTPLIVGGGAGSLYSSGDHPYTAAYMSGPGKWSMGSYSWSDGDGGWGYHGGAGGGFYSAGNSNGSAPDRVGQGFVTGLVGGDGGQGQGGFGGGGGYHSGRNGGGGGGGYSGALGGNADGTPIGGGGLGGSCYIKAGGTNIGSSSNAYPGSSTDLGANRGEGYVQIELL